MRFRISSGLAMLAVTMMMPGCDYFAQKELKVGQSTREDVTKAMGRPEMIWEENDGSQQMEFVRGPEGYETFMVDISPDGHYQGMRNVLTAEYFGKVRPGMSKDDVRRMLGKPATMVEFKRKPEVVWTWRFRDPAADIRQFHVHLDTEGRVTYVDSTQDPKSIGG